MKKTSLIRTLVTGLILFAPGSLLATEVSASDFNKSPIAKQLVAAGATMTTMSEVKRLAKGYGLNLTGGTNTSEAHYCEGAAACADLIESNKCGAYFRCAGNAQGPACVCN